MITKFVIKSKHSKIKNIITTSKTLKIFNFYLFKFFFQKVIITLYKEKLKNPSNRKFRKI
jgi:hypothetical protein